MTHYVAADRLLFVNVNQQHAPKWRVFLMKWSIIVNTKQLYPKKQETKCISANTEEGKHYSIHSGMFLAVKAALNSAGPKVSPIL